MTEYIFDRALNRGFTAFGSQTQSLLLHQHQSKPFELYEDTGVDTLVRGLLMQPAQKMDRAFTDEVRFHLDKIE